MTDEAATPTSEELPAKVWICPACGNRYDTPTTCMNQHEPAVCEEYDVASGEAAIAAADAEAPAAATPAAAATVADDTAAPHVALAAAHDALDNVENALADARAKLDEIVAHFTQGGAA